ncbi:BspA family leucine-rich repeat surface protein, partial [Lactococcus garvieae]
MIKKSSLLLAAGILSLSSTTPLVATATEVTPSPQTKSTSSTPSKPLPSTLPPASSSKGSAPQTSEPASTPQSQSTPRKNVASSQPSGTTTQQQKKSTAQAQQSPSSNLADIASGTNGTVAWNIDAAGTLHLGAGTLADTNRSTSPWDSYKSDIKKISFDGAVIASENSSGLFAQLNDVNNIEGMNNFNTSNVTYMNSMFSGCSSLTTLDLSSFDTSNVTRMGSMFSGCSSLTTLDLSSFDTSNVIGRASMSYMFQGCSSLTTLDLSSFDTSNVIYMSYMFQGCSSLTTLDLSSFDTSSVIYMSYMFQGCSSLTTLDLSSFDTLNVIDMGYMLGEDPIHKLSLGSKIKLGGSVGLNSVPINANYTGKWQSIGTGTPASPNGTWSGDTADLISRSQTGVADTYVWQPIKRPAQDVTVEYVDENGRKLPNVSSQTISGNIGDPYDATTNAYKLKIPGYTLDESKLPANGKGTLSDQAQTVTYVYKENSTPPSKQEVVNVYRLYNKKSMEHLYTADAYEYKHLPELSSDWVREGINFKEYKKSDSTTVTVHRVYNPKSGEHLNTTDSTEVKVLTSKGWKSEGVAFYTPKAGGKPVYRLFNPKAGIGAHFMTADSYE